jgi:hypothetical protein
MLAELLCLCIQGETMDKRIQKFVDSIELSDGSYNGVFITAKGYQVTVTWCPSTRSFRVWSYGTTYYGTKDQLSQLIGYIDFSYKPRGRKAKVAVEAESKG